MLFILIIGVFIVVFGCWGVNSSPAAKVATSSEGNSVQVFFLVVVLCFIGLILVISMGVK